MGAAGESFQSELAFAAFPLRVKGSGPGHVIRAVTPVLGQDVWGTPTVLGPFSSLHPEDGHQPCCFWPWQVCGLRFENPTWVGGRGPSVEPIPSTNAFSQEDYSAQFAL